MNATVREKLPEVPTELAKLAYLLRYADSETLMRDYETATQNVRRRFDEIFNAEGAGGGEGGG